MDSILEFYLAALGGDGLVKSLHGSPDALREPTLSEDLPAIGPSKEQSAPLYPDGRGHPAETTPARRTVDFDLAELTEIAADACRGRGMKIPPGCKIRFQVSEDRMDRPGRLFIHGDWE